MASNILAVGASRNIGYHASLRFLNAGATVTYLLRTPAAFDTDEDVQKYVKSGHARLVKGDALVEQDVRKAWTEATRDKPVDLVLFSVGFPGTPSFNLSKGFVISPANLATQSLLNVLCTMPKSESAPLPKVIAVSSFGVTRASRAKQPLPLKFVYGYLIDHPLQDKRGMERVIAHCGGWAWDEKDREPGEEIMGANWRERDGLPGSGALKDAVVIRAAHLTDGDCLADKAGEKPAYRAGDANLTGWSVSRKDVAHFVFELVTKRWDEFKGRPVGVTY